jgi:hypothetical protein
LAALTASALRRIDMPESDDFASELRSDRPGRSMIKRRDPWAIAVAALSILTQFGMWVWWGGRLDQRVAVLESDAVDGRKLQREDSKEKVSIDGLQNVQIAGMQVDIRAIKESVDRIDRKIPERAR